MGSAMTTHLAEQDFIVHGFDVSEEARKTAKEAGVDTSDSITESIEKMEGRKVVWLMVPSGLVDEVLKEVLPSLKASDIVIDGGNSFFKESIRREAELSK